MIPFGGFMQLTGGQVPVMDSKGFPATFAPDGGMQAGEGENGFPACVKALLGFDVSGNTELGLSVPVSSETSETPETVETVETLEMDVDPLADTGADAAKWLMVDGSETDIPAGELPVAPDSPSSDMDPLSLADEMASTAGVPNQSEVVSTIGVQTDQRTTGGPGGSWSQPDAGQRPHAAAPDTPPMPVQSQTMRTGDQSSGPGQDLAPPPSNADPMASRSSDGLPMVRKSSPEMTEPSAPVDQRVSAPSDRVVQATDKNAREAVNQHREPAAGEALEKPKITSSGNPLPQHSAPNGQAGNPIGADDNPESQQNPSGRFQARDTDQLPSRLESAENEKNPFSTAMSSESAKPNAAESIKAPPVLPEATRNPQMQSPTVNASTPVRMGETPEKSFQTTVMDQIVDRAALRSIQGRSEVQIRLKPEFLGNVQMNIATDKNQVVVRILTDQPAVKEIIETHLHQLKAELGNQGMTIDRFDIAVNPDTDNPNQRDQFANMFRNNSSRDGQRQANNSEPESEMNEEEQQAADQRPGHDGVNYFA